MPSTSVVVSASARDVPMGGVDFVDPNKHEFLRIWNVTKSAIAASTVPRGDTISVKAYKSFNPDVEDTTPPVVLRWYLDGVRQNASDNAQSFQVPSGTNANYVGAFVTVIDPVNGLVPHALDIQISYP